MNWEEAYLIRVVLQGAVIAVVSNSISVRVSLVNVVDVWAVILLVQDTCRQNNGNGRNLLVQ